LGHFLHFLWFGLVAAIVLVAAAEALARTIVRLRARRFETEERGDLATDRGLIADDFGIPEVSPSETTTFRRLDDLEQPLDARHEEANLVQGLYHTRVARCVSCLGLALAILGLSLTVFHGSAWFEEFAAAAEVVALGLALYHWWSARNANGLWVATRTKVEFLRQWTFLQAFLATGGADGAGQASREAAAKAAEIDEALLSAPSHGWWQWIARLLRPPGASHLSKTLEERVQGHWDKVRAAYAAMPAAAGEVARADLHLYLRRRPVRQLAWFGLAHKRLHRSSRLREDLMARLFLLSAGLAVGKLALVAWHGWGRSSGGAVQAASGGGGVSFVDLPTAISLVALALLAATTVSAAAASIYLSRNDRSLMHRYAFQQRRIRSWLKRVAGGQSAGSSAAGSVPWSRFRDDVLEFEDIMVEELIDWIHISAHDALELAP
jgi:hypothetical protein